jgi:hypothetical protein
MTTPSATMRAMNRFVVRVVCIAFSIWFALCAADGLSQLTNKLSSGGG